MSDRPLTAKQQRFVEEYLVDLNSTQAARRAGYSKRSAEDIGRRLVRKGPVKSAIDAALAIRKAQAEARADEAWLTHKWVTQRLKAEAEVAGEGSSHSARVRALELLGKHIGMFKDTVSVEGPAFKIYAGFDPSAV